MNSKQSSHPYILHFHFQKESECHAFTSTKLGWHVLHVLFAQINQPEVIIRSTLPSRHDGKHRIVAIFFDCESNWPAALDSLLKLERRIRGGCGEKGRLGVWGWILGPAPSHRLSVCLFLPLCSHCYTLPDRRCLGWGGSVNCKGMRTKITDVSWDFRAQFLPFSRLGVWNTSTSGLTFNTKHTHTLITVLAAKAWAWKWHMSLKTRTWETKNSRRDKMYSNHETFRKKAKKKKVLLKTMLNILHN